MTQSRLRNKYQKIFPKEYTNGFNLNILHPVEPTILKYKNHPSLNTIRAKISKLDNLNIYFEYTFFEKTLKELKIPDPKKASQVNDIPVKVIKENKDIVAFFIHYNLSNLLSSFTSPTALKYADVKPVFKKDDISDNENYRPISILSP